MASHSPALPLILVTRCLTGHVTMDVGRVLELEDVIGGKVRALVPPGLRTRLHRHCCRPDTPG